MALVNELQIQESIGSDEEIDISTSSKTAILCKLAQVPPEIWMTLLIEAKKWLLNERKRQQQEDDKLKSHQVARILSKFPKRKETIPPKSQVNIQESKIQ